MKKGISPLIAAVILIAFVIAVAAVASGFFTGFIKGRQLEISEKGETVVECGVANLQIQEDILSCSAPNWNSMVGRWHLDEGSGLTAYDSSKNSYSGTLKNGTEICSGGYCPSWDTGKYGDALKFDGDGDYVATGKDLDQFGVNHEYTFSLWVKMPSLPTGDDELFGTYWSHGIKTVSNEMKVYGFAAFTTSGHTTTNSVNITQGKWTHIAFTANDNNDKLKLYKNGTLKRTATGSGELDYLPREVVIARRGNQDQWYFNGTIDEVRIYNKALSQSQIEYLYSHGTHLRFPIHNKGRTSLGKKFGVTAIINGTSVSGSVSLDNSLDKAQIQTVTALENITAAGKLDKVRIASKACGSVYDSVEPSGVYC